MVCEEVSIIQSLYTVAPDNMYSVSQLKMSKK